MKFFDTNILVYVADIRDPQKQRIADFNDGQIYCGMKVVNPFKTITP